MKYWIDWSNTQFEVNVANRMEWNRAPGKVNISGDTYELVKDLFKFEYRGKVKAKHKGEIDMYFVEAWGFSSYASFLKGFNP